MESIVDRKNVKQVIKYFIATFVLLLCSASQFYRLNKVGIFDSSDGMIYLQFAMHWSDGFFSNQWAKPGAHLLGMLAVNVLGYHDYTTTYLNAFMNLATMVLMLFLGRAISLPFSYALSGVALYVAIPYANISIQTGLVHIASTPFVLFSLLMVLYFLEKHRPLCMLFGGFSAAFSATIHPTLFSCILSTSIVFALICIKNFSIIGYRKIITALIFYIASLFSVFIFFSYLIYNTPLDGLPRYYERLTEHRGRVIEGAQTLIGKFNATLMHAGDYMSPELMILGSVIVVAAIIVFIRLCTDRRKIFCVGCLSQISIVTLYLLINIVVLGFLSPAAEPRFMLPLDPLICLCIAYLFGFVMIHATGSWHEKYFLGLTLVFIVYMASTNSFDFLHKKISFYRLVADSVCNKINSENKMLIASSITYFDGYPFFIYFDRDSYLKLNFKKNLDPASICSAHIRYILFPKELNDVMRINNEYCFECERIDVLEAIATLKPRLFVKDPRFSIYVLDYNQSSCSQPSNTDNFTSYEAYGYSPIHGQCVPIQ